MHDDNDDPPSRRGALIAFAVILLLVLGGLWLTGVLGSASRIQDCVMSGRSNCAPIR